MKKETNSASPTANQFPAIADFYSLTFTFTCKVHEQKLLLF